MTLAEIAAEIEAIKGGPTTRWYRLRCAHAGSLVDHDEHKSAVDSGRPPPAWGRPKRGDR